MKCFQFLFRFLTFNVWVHATAANAATANVTAWGRRSWRGVAIVIICSIDPELGDIRVRWHRWILARLVRVHTQQRELPGRLEVGDCCPIRLAKRAMEDVFSPGMLVRVLADGRVRVHGLLESVASCRQEFWPWPLCLHTDCQCADCQSVVLVVAMSFSGYTMRIRPALT